MKYPGVSPLAILFGLPYPIFSLSFSDKPDYTGMLPQFNVSEKLDLLAGARVVGHPFWAAVGDIVIPDVKLPKGADANQTHCVAIWVGIGGNSDCGEELKSGLTACIADGKPVHKSWFSWSPEFARPGVDIKGGDKLRMTAEINVNRIWFVLENMTTGKSTKEMYYYTPGKDCFCDGESPENLSAMWFVQPYSYDGWPLPDFGTIEISRASAGAGAGGYNVSKGTIYEMENFGKKLTKTHTDGEMTLFVEYIG